MFTKEQLKSIEKYLMAYQITSGEFLESRFDRHELHNAITAVKTEITKGEQTTRSKDQIPMNLKPCKDGETFEIEYAYAEDLDITFIMRRKIRNEDIVGEEVCGYYHGTPDPILINDWINDLYWDED